MSKHPQTLTADESEQLLIKLRWPAGEPRGGPKAIRNYTMALLMLDAGLRVGELVKLLRTDLWFNSKPVTSLVVPAAITKTRLERIVPLTDRLHNAIEQMQGTRWSEPDAHPTCYAFTKTCVNEPLTTRQVERIIRQAGLVALGRPVHPHMLRHTFASRLMRITNSRTVQQLLGHKQLSSTQIYTHPNADDLKTAIGGLNIESGKYQINKAGQLRADKSQMSDNSTPV